MLEETRGYFPFGSKTVIPFPQSGAVGCVRDERDEREREQPIRQ